MKQPPSAVVHFYRAIVMHADVWRERLDATTNWAVVTTIGVISFSFTRPDSPHFILLLLNFAGILFLIMESRRYQTYDIWRRRIRALNQYMIAPQLAPHTAPPVDEIEREMAELADDLGRAVPHIHFLDAAGYRLRRNYGYIFLFTIGSWAIKLFLHPDDAATTTELLDRASIGMISGTMIIILVVIFVILVVFIALRAPSEQMVRWRQLPSPLNRLTSGSLFHRPMTEEEEERDSSPRKTPQELEQDVKKPPGSKTDDPSEPEG